ncbi:marine proteobacterial sortase target protein [Pelagibius sp. 7325]|uniref:marine proteobacterial sortase target protein n=1 Tax=Pelagibius sp. 7325 TaxID=3131994 RepID=UPI0030ED5E35
MRHDPLPLPTRHLGLDAVIPPRLGRAHWRSLTVMAAALALVLVVMLGSLAARAEAPLTRAQAAADDGPIGLFFRAGPDGSVLQAPTLKTAVDLEVNGMVARATVRQVFHNPTGRWLEGIYVFPLPERSAVDRLTMVIGERRVEGRIMEKAEAERAYKEAAANGQRASLVSGERPNVFVTAVANIGPGEDITVEIGFQDAVTYDNGVFALRFPMVVAPRYTPAPDDAEVAEAPARTPGPSPAVVRTAEDAPRDLFGPVNTDRLDTDPETANPLSLTLHLNAGMPLAGLRSLYHPVVIQSDGEGRQTMTLKADAVPADRDFVVEWQPAPSAEPRAAVFAEQAGADAHLLVMMMPPSGESNAAESQAGESKAGAPAPLSSPALPREVIFVIDTSGSMHGASIDQAKTALITALKRLNPEDRFNVIQFNNQTHALFPHPAAASVGNVAQAWHYVSALEADGGTEMLPALDLSLDNQSHDGFLRQVVFITDAAVGNEDELFRHVAEKLGDSRLFTVGIGSAPNSYFMRKAAELGRGSFTYIGDLGEVETRMSALLAKLEQPALTDIRVGWPLSAGKRIELYPTPLPDLYAGEPVTFAVRLEGVDLDKLDGQLLVTGNAAEGSWQQRVALTGLTNAPGVAALWARAKLTQIEDGLYRVQDNDIDRTAIRAEALALALDHQLVTRYTSLVAIDEAVARPRDEDLQSGEVARDLPAGWDAGKVFGDAAIDPTADPAATQQGAIPTPVPFAQTPLEVAEEASMRRVTLPAPLLQQARADGAAVSLPQTATPAERMAVVGSAYLLLALALILLVMHRRRRAGDPRG